MYICITSIASRLTTLHYESCGFLLIYASKILSCKDCGQRFATDLKKTYGIGERRRKQETQTIDWTSTAYIKREYASCLLYFTIHLWYLFSLIVVESNCNSISICLDCSISFLFNLHLFSLSFYYPRESI
jgi:hypothetical protein